MASPVKVKRHRTEGGRLGWQWTCTEHIRAHGLHRDETWGRAWRERYGKPMETPWERCLRGALRHWFTKHSAAGRALPREFNS